MSKRILSMPITGEAAETQICNALTQAGCMVTRSDMVPGKGGWVYNIYFRRPHWLKCIFGYGVEQYLYIYARMVPPRQSRRYTRTPEAWVSDHVIRYTVQITRTDGKGSFREWTCRGLNQVLESIR